MKGIYSYGFDKPSLVQQRAIMSIIKGNDVIVQIQVGMVKHEFLQWGHFRGSKLKLKILKI